MAEIPILDVVNATTVYTTGNIDDGKTVDLTALVPVKVGEKWEIQNTLALVYTDLSMMTTNGPAQNEQLSFTVQSGHTLRLPGNIKTEVNMLYQSPAPNGLYTMAAMGRVDLAVNKAFFSKKMDVTLRGNDLFKTWRYNWTTDIDGNVNNFNQYFRIRNVVVSLRYNFSSGKKVEAAKSRNVEELNRI
jgi:hypothetical protein